MNYFRLFWKPLATKYYHYTIDVRGISCMGNKLETHTEYISEKMRIPFSFKVSVLFIGCMITLPHIVQHAFREKYMYLCKFKEHILAYCLEGYDGIMGIKAYYLFSSTFQNKH